jgi:hypothetical protein
LPEECYFPCGDVNILAKKIFYKFSNPENSGLNYDDILREKYNWDKIAEDTTRVYEGVYA